MPTVSFAVKMAVWVPGVRLRLRLALAVMEETNARPFLFRVMLDWTAAPSR